MNEPCDLRISGSIPAPLHLIFSRFGSSLGSFQSSKKKKRNKNHWVLGDFQTCPAHHNRMLIQGAPTDKCERSSTSTQGLKQPSTRPPSLCRCTGPVPFFPKSFTQIPPCNLSAPHPNKSRTPSCRDRSPLREERRMPRCDQSASPTPHSRPSPPPREEDKWHTSRLLSVEAQSSILAAVSITRHAPSPTRGRILRHFPSPPPARRN